MKLKIGYYFVSYNSRRKQTRGTKQKIFPKSLSILCYFGDRYKEGRGIWYIGIWFITQPSFVWIEFGL